MKNKLNHSGHDVGFVCSILTSKLEIGDMKVNIEPMEFVENSRTKAVCYLFFLLFSLLAIS